MVNLNSKSFVQNRLLVAEWANDCQDLLENQTYVFKTSFTTKKICSNFDLKRHCLVQFLTSIWNCVSVNSQLQNNDVFHEEWHFSHFQIPWVFYYRNALRSHFEKHLDMALVRHVQMLFKLLLSEGMPNSDIGCCQMLDRSKHSLKACFEG